MKFSASCLLLAASLVGGTALAQPAPFSPQERIHWIDGQTVTITYSHSGAPAGVSTALMAEVLADVEAKYDSLNIAGLSVNIGNREIANGCDGRARNTVLVCWEARTDDFKAIQTNYGVANGNDFWREGVIKLSSTPTTPWTEAALYAEVQHQLLHILGFGHPAPGTSVQTGAADLTQIDIDGLQAMYGAGSCAITYDAATRTVAIPFVKYRGGAYSATLQYEGNSEFSIVPGSITAMNSTNMPMTRCHNLSIDGNNDLNIPQVRIGNQLYWANLRFVNGRLMLTGRGQ